MREDLYYVASSPFEAARQVDVLPQGHRAARLHGHSFLAKVRARLPEKWGPFAGAEVDELEERLRRTVEPLDYRLLNDEISVPTDENLARWIRDRIDLQDIESIGIQSTRDQGVDIDDRGCTHIWRRFRFEAAHRLPNVHEGHPCGRMHGHGFEVILHVEQNIGTADLGMDFDLIEEIWQPFHEQLHYRCLNDIAGLENPTSEMLCNWIWQQVKPQLPQLSWVSVYETVTAGCHHNGSDYRIWKEQRFEAATNLGTASESDPRARLHGHSYLMRLHLTAPLDDVLGWTVDYGDVKQVFEPVYKQLDHHNLGRLNGIDTADVATIARWVRDRLSNLMPELDRFDLYQKSGCGCVLNWGERAPALPV